MRLTDGWIVVIICVTACLLILSIGIYHIPDDESEDHESQEAHPDHRAGGAVRPGGRHRRSG